MFKKNEFVVKVIVGGGTKTATVQKVGSVKKGVATLVGAESLAYDANTGREIDPAIPGFYSELIALDGDEDKRLKLEALNLK